MRKYERRLRSHLQVQRCQQTGIRYVGKPLSNIVHYTMVGWTLLCFRLYSWKMAKTSPCVPNAVEWVGNVSIYGIAIAADVDAYICLTASNRFQAASAFSPCEKHTNVHQHTLMRKLKSF